MERKRKHDPNMPTTSKATEINSGENGGKKPSADQEEKKGKVETSNDIDNIIIAQVESAVEEVVVEVDPIAIVQNNENVEDYSDIFQLLECLICMNLPRRGPLYFCTNGHYLCNDCLKLKKPDLATRKFMCDKCGDWRLNCRNLFAENFLDKLFKTKKIECKNDILGCTIKGLLPEIELHEQQCPKQLRTCAGVFPSCNWKGFLSDAIPHMLEKYCASIAPRKNDVYIGLLNVKALNLQLKNRMRAWTPKLLNDAEHKHIMAYFMCYRKEGTWFFYVKSYASPDIRVKYRANIVIRACGNVNYPVFSITSKLYAHEATEDDLIRSGMCLTLNDQQIQQVSNNNTIMQFFIRIYPAMPPPLMSCLP
jgi:hypothetical protein